MPVKSAMIQKILHEYHHSPIKGHAGIAQTTVQIVSHFYWPKMKDEIKNFMQQCVVCQQAKTEHTIPIGVLQSLLVPSQVWEDVAMDFINGLPLSCWY